MTKPFNPWKYAKKIDPEDVKNNPYVNPPKQEVPPGQPAGKTPQLLDGDYTIIIKPTYADAVDVLRQDYKDGKIPSHPTIILPDSTKTARPLTFKETLEERLKDYNTEKNKDSSARTEEQRLALFQKWIDSCTGIAYRANTDKFKLIPACNNLIQIASGFNKDYLPADYSKLVGIELDRTQAKYDGLLAKQEFLSHPAWLASVEDDKKLLKDYTELVFKLLKNPEQAMSFWLRSKTTKDELCALAVSILGVNSDADGANSLVGEAHLLLVSPK